MAQPPLWYALSLSHLPMLKRLAIGALLIAIGFAAGVYATRWWLRAHLWLGAVGQSFTVSQYASLQYREASYADAKQALEAYLDYLSKLRPSSDEWKPGEDPFMNARAIRVEQTLTWSRLALLHERNANPAAAETAWKQAESLAPAVFHRDPSRNNLRRILERTDGTQK